MTPITNSQASLEVSATDQKRFITEWIVGSRVVCLFQEPNCLSFSIDGRAGKTTRFRPTLYDTRYALNLISLFHRTIGVNLENDEVHSSCFLPKLCISAHNAPEVQVALFGRVDARVHVEGELKGLRFGVFNTANNEEHTLEAVDAIAKIFIQGAPGSNRPNMRAVLDRKGKEVMRPAPDHYAMNSYVKRFSVLLTRDALNNIINVALHRISLLDKNVTLDESNWAVTLVSSKSASHSIWERIFTSRIGHAMLACEGIENGKQFLRYVHFTPEPSDPHPKLEKDEALMDSFDVVDPLDTENGPTWTRTKILVKNMFDFVATMREVPLQFALYGTFFADEGLSWNALFKSKDQLREGYFENTPGNCLNWAEAIAGKCGIIFAPSIPSRRPLDKIDILRSAPICHLPSGFPSFCFGNPFPIEYRQLSLEILASCVILTPLDSTPKEVDLWHAQYTIEIEGAVSREFARIKSATTLEEIMRRDYKPELKW